jgi:uncharacterized protein
MDADPIGIILAGGRGAGKRTFIVKISEPSIVNSRNTFVTGLAVMPYGALRIGETFGAYLAGIDLYLLSVLSGDELNDLREMGGFCLLIDSADKHSLLESLALYKHLTLFNNVPHIVVANKRDRHDAMTIEQIRREMELPDKTIILPCVATERASVVNVLNTLLVMLRPDLTERIK